LFSISSIQTCPKIMEFFVVFIGRVRDFTNDFWKILKDILTKIDIWNNFFFKILLFSICFFYYFLHFIFNFVYVYLSTNSSNFYVFLFYWLEILSKNFGKSWNTFLKNIDIWNPKFFINSIVSCFVFFYFFSILIIFFPYFTYPNLSKNSKQFCGALLYGL